MSIPPLLNGPIPPYSNPPIEPQYYKPRLFFISAISLGITTLVTTTVNHDYVVAQECRLLIPRGYGSRELNEVTGLVVLIPAPNQVILNIPSTNVTPFISANLSQRPQIVAIGDLNFGLISSGVTIRHSPNIPGSFVNISPY